MIFIPGNVPSSKNSKVWTGKFLVSSKAVQQWKRDTKRYWIQYQKQFLDLLDLTSPPYRIKFTFIRGTRHKFDYINPAQTVQDEMVHQGWLADDNCTILKPVFGSYSYDKQNPGVWIKVLI